MFHIIGINPEKCEDHEVYINKLCADYEEAIKTMFHLSRADDSKGGAEIDDLVTEVMQHIKICQANCEVFFGMEEALNVRFSDLGINMIKSSVYWQT